MLYGCTGMRENGEQYESASSFMYENDDENPRWEFTNWSTARSSFN